MEKALHKSCLFMILIITLLSLTSCFLFGAAVAGVSMDRETLSVAIGETKGISATVMPENASDPSVSWSSSAQSIATVNQSGAVTGVAVGTATVTVTTTDGGFTDTCALTVTEPIDVTGVVLTPTTAEAAIGYTVTLTATISPADATFKTVTWSTTDPDVATVSNGVVTGVAAGTATITVTTTDGGFTDTCDMTVVEPGQIGILIE